MTEAARQATRPRFDAPLTEPIAEAAASSDSAHSFLGKTREAQHLPGANCSADVLYPSLITTGLLLVGAGRCRCRSTRRGNL